MTRQAAEVPITLRGAPAGAGDRRLDETHFQEMAASPDGRKVAFIAHGQVFAASAKDGGTAITFALAFIPLVGLTGAAVDYSRGNSAKAAMQMATGITVAAAATAPPLFPFCLAAVPCGRSALREFGGHDILCGIGGRHGSDR